MRFTGDFARAWLVAVAKRRAIGAWRRAATQDERYAQLARSLDDTGSAAGLPRDPDAIDDDVLRLVFIAWGRLSA